MAIPVLQGNFENVISTQTLPVVIEFFAAWCPKCSMMEPVFERISSQLSKDIFFYKVDIDLSEAEVEKLGIEIVPTFVVFFKGGIIGYTTGVLSEKLLKHRILEMTKGLSP